MVMEETHEEEHQPPMDDDTLPEPTGMSGGQRLLARILKRFVATAWAETVFGEPNGVDGVSIVPVSRAMCGLGVPSNRYWSCRGLRYIADEPPFGTVLDSATGCVRILKGELVGMAGTLLECPTPFTPDICSQHGDRHRRNLRLSLDHSEVLPGREDHRDVAGLHLLLSRLRELQPAT